ncbi:hypothetical protein MVEN_02387300 [Mycena venus]|uniref:F-box domain-containing protein n=1 Tax=Mycena venus TaxID=2733690 RepID=A0A8H6X286_9AGAR|nr:hypothetical protein MVEN_02387300 [Mycena venus]
MSASEGWLAQRAWTTLPPPLLTLPSEILELCAFHLATAPPNLGPPAALLPLLSVCRDIHRRLGWGRNWGFWARLNSAKFTPSPYPGYLPYDGYPYDPPDAPSTSSSSGNTTKLIRSAHALRARCSALSIIRRGDPFAPGAARALKIAHSDDLAQKGKNRRQLAWANARAFSLRYVRERLYEGRYGDDELTITDSNSLSAAVSALLQRAFPDPPISPADILDELLEDENQLRHDLDAAEALEAQPESAHPAWRVGWPRDAEPSAAAMWVLWAFESEETLRAEPESLRRHMMALLLPMVVAPFRYASALAPPHHYTVPLLPEVYASAAFDDAQMITVPTNHGPERLSSTLAPRAIATGPRTPPTAAQDSSARRPRASSSSRACRSARGWACPPHLPRDRAEAEARFYASGGVGTPPIGPTQEDVLEKNARPMVRFERQLPTVSSSSSSTSTPSTTLTPTAIDALRAVDPGADVDSFDADGDTASGRLAPPLWRSRLCRTYDAPASSTSSSASSRGAPAPAAVGPRTTPAAPSAGTGLETRTGSGRGGAPPGRIGPVYTPGSFTGLWAGTMLMPSEQAYTRLIETPGGVFPQGGLANEEFVTARRPVYMRLREHWSFHPNHPVPPPAPNSTTADEGMRTGWLPPGARVVGVGGSAVEVRVPSGSAPLDLSAPATTSASGWDGRRAETSYTYHTPVDARAPAAEHPAHDRESCPGCVRATSEAGGRTSASLSGGSDADWSEWDAPAWAAHRFDEDEGWERGCDGVQDVVFEGETDQRHGMAWYHYEFAGRVRPWDGLIGLVMRPRERTLGMPTYFISGHLVGKDTFEGTWQMAVQDPLTPSWGGSICLARGED